MRHLLLVLLAACAHPATAVLPYVDGTTDNQGKPLELIERGSGVVRYDAAPSRISVRDPSVATVVRFDGDARFHLFGEAVGETVLVSEIGEARYRTDIAVVASDLVDADIALAVGERSSFSVGAAVEAVVVGDPGVLSFKVVGALGAEADSVQVQALRAGRTHVVVSTGDAAPSFRWVVVR